MSLTVPPGSWPTDQGHRDAIETLLLMSEAEDRWDEPARALDLLENVEQIVGPLPQLHERLSRRRRAGSGRR